MFTLEEYIATLALSCQMHEAECPGSEKLKRDAHAKEAGKNALSVLELKDACK